MQAAIYLSGIHLKHLNHGKHRINRHQPPRAQTGVQSPTDESKLEGQELMDAIRRRRNAEAYRTDMAAVISILKRR